MSRIPPARPLPPRGLSVLGVFDGPEGNLGEDSEEIIRSEAGKA